MVKMQITVRRFMRDGKCEMVIASCGDSCVHFYPQEGGAEAFRRDEDSGTFFVDQEMPVRLFNRFLAKARAAADKE